MGLFFKKKTYESTKLVVALRTVIAIIMSALLLMSILNQVASFPLGLLFVFGGIGSTIEAIEAYRKAENKKEWLVELGFAVLWFVLAIQFLQS